MGLPVTQWLASDPTWSLGMVGGSHYYRVPKPDGGYDYFRVYSDVKDPNSQLVASAISYEDLHNATGFNEETEKTGATTGLSLEQINANNARHSQAIKEINQAYQNGLINWEQKNIALDQSKNDIMQQKDQGLENNNAYFSNVSPDAFQSQIGNYNQKVLDAYQQGQNTISNDQALITNYKQNIDAQKTEGLNAENAYNPTTGSYAYGAGWSPGAVINAPNLTPLDTGISKLSAGQVPNWAPNYGGLSTMQAKVNPNDPYSYLKS